MAYTTIDKPSDYFNTKLYTGNGTDNHAITEINFQPDFIWIKPRNEARGHHIQTAIRGTSKALITNETSAEYTGLTNVIKSFDSDGFTLGTSNDVNKSANTHVAWNWKCETGVSGTTTSGSQRSYSGRVNTTAGISIINYAGNTSAGHTIPHHLGVAPKMMIIKNLGDVGNWIVYHASTTDFRYYLQLNGMNATTLDSGMYDNVPTSSGFLVGSNVDVNDDNQQYLAYCFAEKQGYSKFGSYTGNNNADGTFVYTGFKPAFVMIKSSSDSSTWHLADNKRIGYNPKNYRAQPNNSNAEYTGVEIYSDFLSNGFKLRNADTDTNGARTYIYMAFAESPFVTSTGIPTTAR